MATPGAIGVARQALSEVRADDLRALARRIRRLPTADDIAAVSEAVLAGRLLHPGG